MRRPSYIRPAHLAHLGPSGKSWAAARVVCDIDVDVIVSADGADGVDGNGKSSSLEVSAR